VEDTGADESISVFKKNSLGKPGLDSCVNFYFLIARKSVLRFAVYGM